MSDMVNSSFKFRKLYNLTVKIDLKPQKDNNDISQIKDDRKTNPTPLFHSPMKYMNSLHMPVPNTKSFMRLGMKVKGMQTRDTIRSLMARDSRKRLVTVLMRRFLTSTAMMRLLPRPLRRKMRL